MINALGGNDFVAGQAGNDQIDAGAGNDIVVGGDGDDTITGGAGDDKLGGEAGADTFVFDPAAKEGADTILDINAEEGDKIAFSAAGLEKFDIDPNNFSGASLDGNENFHLDADKAGDVQITYPGGTIALHGIAFTEGLTFAELGGGDLFTVSTLTVGTDQADNLTGTDGNDVIDAKGGDDIITPGSGDDTITTGAGRDQVNIDPNNPNEGHDTITDFTAPSGVDPTAGDFLAFKLADILAADPTLPAADGDAASLSLEDLDKSDKWTLSAAKDGNLLFTHPGGSVEFSDIAFNDQHFANIGSSLLVDGREFTTPIPVVARPAPAARPAPGVGRPPRLAASRPRPLVANRPPAVRRPLAVRRPTSTDHTTTTGGEHTVASGDITGSDSTSWHRTACDGRRPHRGGRDRIESSSCSGENGERGRPRPRSPTCCSKRRRQRRRARVGRGQE